MAPQPCCWGVGEQSPRSPTLFLLRSRVPRSPAPCSELLGQLPSYARVFMEGEGWSDCHHCNNVHRTPSRKRCLPSAVLSGSLCPTDWPSGFGLCRGSKRRRVCMLALKHSLRSMSKRKKSLGTLILAQVTGVSLTWPDLTKGTTTSQWH